MKKKLKKLQILPLEEFAGKSDVSCNEELRKYEDQIRTRQGRDALRRAWAANV